MSNPFLSEIRMMSFGYAPKGWALCNGQTLAINQNQALFSLLGTTYGGNGQTTFALPNLQGRAPIHQGDGHGLGEVGGEEVHTLTLQEMPAHPHVASAVNAPASTTTPNNNYLAQSASLYGPAPGNTSLAPDAITTAGGSQAHENRQPYLTVSFAIALAGIFPSRN